jgi:hypothetical protein
MEYGQGLVGTSTVKRPYNSRIQEELGDRKKDREPSPLSV